MFLPRRWGWEGACTSSYTNWDWEADEPNGGGDCVAFNVGGTGGRSS
jgi:hypothetical protein